jgi:hypothetical protein
MTFQNEPNYWQKSWCCRIVMNLVSTHHFANSTVPVMTLSPIIITGLYAEWFVSYSLLDCRFHTSWLWRRVISTKGARQVWSVSRGYLLLRGTLSYLCIYRGSMLLYTGFVIAFWIMITFYTLLTSLLYYDCQQHFRSLGTARWRSYGDDTTTKQPIE